MLLGKQTFISDIGSPFISEVLVYVPLDVLLLLCFRVFSGLSVFLFSVYVQLRQNVPCSTRSGAVPLPAADLLAHAVSTPKQCERCKEGSVSYHSLHLNSDST